MRTFKKRLYVAALMVAVGSLLFTVRPIPTQAELVKKWVSYFKGPGPSTNSAKKVTPDLHGHVVVSGSVSGAGADQDMGVVKYGSNGQQLWSATYNGSGNSDDAATAHAVDNAGNFYVTGYSMGANGHIEATTVKYDPNIFRGRRGA